MAIEQTPGLERALQLAADHHASDLYLLPGEPVSLRIGGKVKRIGAQVLTAEQVRAIATAAVGKDRLATIGPEKGRVISSCGLPGVVGGQMCIASSRGEYGVVIRIVGSRIMTPDRLAVPEAFLRATRSRNGLLLFTGVPGSGKTTTVFSVLEDINLREAKHICTVEDPISATLTPKCSLVQQREIGVDVPDALAGIAAAMRQDADVLFVGELKTPEEVQAVIAASQMQYLVMTQLNTAHTPEMAIGRLIESQPPEHVEVFRRQLAQVLRGVIGQVLLPRADGKGKIAAYGVLIPDEQMRRAISEGKPFSDWQRPLPEGCQSLSDDIERLRREGAIADAVAQETIALVQ